MRSPLRWLLPVLVLSGSVSAARFEDPAVYVPLPTLVGVAEWAAADLDGDGRSEFVARVAATVGVSSGDDVLTVLRYDVASGSYSASNGQVVPPAYRGLAVRLVSYRVPGAGARQGVAMLVDEPGAQAATAGLLYEGVPAQRSQDLGFFLLQVPLTLGDVDADGTLDVFTASATGVSRWRIDGDKPELEVPLPGCRSNATTPCRFGQLGNFDSDPAPELLVAGEQLLVLDANTLAVEWSVPLALGFVRGVNVDADAALEIVGSSSIGDTVRVFDPGLQLQVGSFAPACGSSCQPNFVLADVVGSDGRAELLTTNNVDQLFRQSLPSGTSLPVVSAPERLLLGAAQMDGAGDPELLMSREPNSNAGMLWLVLAANGTTVLKQFYAHDRGITDARLDTRSGVQEVTYGNWFSGTQGIATGAALPSGAITWQSPDPPGALRAPVDQAIADLNGDGTTDIVLLTDSSVVAYSGVSHQALWSFTLPIGPPFARRLLLANVDGDPALEALVGYGNVALEARDIPNGALLWTASSGAPNSADLLQMSLVQLDDDPALEALLVSGGGVTGYELAAGTPVFRQPMFPVRGATVIEHNGTRELLVYVQDFFQGPVQVYSVPGGQFLRFLPFPAGYYGTGMAAIPGRDAYVAGTEQGEFLAVDGSTGALIASSPFVSNRLGLHGVRVTPTPSLSRFRVEAGGVAAFARFELDLAAPLLNDGFEGAAR